jgi:hypothetical protein
MIWDEDRLLALEVDAIYGLTSAASGGPPLLKDQTVRAVCAWSPRARLLALAPGTATPDPHGGGPQKYAPGEPPDVLLRLAERLGKPSTSVEGGPCFVFPGRLTAPAAPMLVIVSDGEGRQAARELVRPANWEPGEWSELISGRIGEWAMAVDDTAPVSICHTPASNATAAEAGIWTHPDFRGRRLAPSVVAAWAARERRNKDVLFYSTSATNHASQSVARHLGLTPLGWIWTVRQNPGTRKGCLFDQRHPF